MGTRRLIGLRVAARVILSLLALCPDILAATMTLGNGSAYPGYGVANVPMSLSLATGDQVAAAQWDIVFDCNILNLCTIYAGPSATAAGKSISFSRLNPGTVRVLVTGFNITSMPEGLLATVSFSAFSTAMSGDHEIHIERVVLSNPYGIEVMSGGVSGLITLDAEPLPTGPNACLGIFGASGIMAGAGLLCLRRTDRGKCIRNA